MTLLYITTSYIYISVSYTCAFVKHININAPGKNTYTKKSKKKILNIHYIIFIYTFFEKSKKYECIGETENLDSKVILCAPMKNVCSWCVRCVFEKNIFKIQCVRSVLLKDIFKKFLFLQCFIFVNFLHICKDIRRGVLVFFNIYIYTIRHTHT